MSASAIARANEANHTQNGQAGSAPKPPRAPTVSAGGGSMAPNVIEQGAPIAGGQPPAVTSSDNNFADAIELKPDGRYRIGDDVFEFSHITGALTRVPELQQRLSLRENELTNLQNMADGVLKNAEEKEYW